MLGSSELAEVRRYADDESVDPIYLDPPLNSNTDYNVLFAEHSGEKTARVVSFWCE